MTLAAVAFAATMNAQFYVGGSLGFETKTTSTDFKDVNDKGDEITKTVDNTWSKFSIKPEVGYKLNDKMAVGLTIGFSSTDDKDANNNKISEFEIAPYFRYTFITWNKVSLFADAQLAYTTGTTTEYFTEKDGKESSSDNTINSFGISIRPGIAYQANEKISFVAHIGNLLGYKHEKLSEVSTANTFSVLGLNTLGLEIGAYYNF